MTRRSILERIAVAATPDPSVTCLEIGPGKGALTEHLLPRCSRLIAVETDQVLVHYLEQKFRAEQNLSVLHADILQVNLEQWGKIAVAGHLPYYITSPIVRKVLQLRDQLSSAVFLVQKEVAERIVAEPGSRNYGFLSVQCQVSSEAKLLFGVPPAAFRPPPAVDSAVVRLVPREHALVDDVSGFLEFASACFRQKRKTLRNNLSELYGKSTLDQQPEAGLRAEQLPVQDLVQLWRRLGTPVPDQFVTSCVRLSSRIGM